MSIVLIIALYWHIVALYLTDPAFQAVRPLAFARHHRPTPAVPRPNSGAVGVNMKRAGEALTVGGSCLHRAVRKRKRAVLALEDLSVDVSEKEFSSLPGITNLAQTVKEIPGDLKLTFYEDRKWFGDTTETPHRPYRSVLRRLRKELVLRTPCGVVQ